MAQLSSAGYPQLTQLATVLFEKGLEGLPRAARNSGMFIVDSVGMNSGDVFDVYEDFESDQYAGRVGEGDKAPLSKVSDGYGISIRPVRHGKDVEITYVLRRNNKYPEVVRKLTSLAPSCVNRQELDLTHRITFGEDTTYVDKDGVTIDITTGDGLALFSTIKKLKSSSETYRNILANNPLLSPDAVTLIERQAVQNSYDPFGAKVAMPNFDLLFTGTDPSDIKMAKSICTDTSDPTQANPAKANQNQGTYRHVILPLLATDAKGQPDSTKERRWGIASTSRSTAHLKVWDEAAMLAQTPSVVDPSTEDWLYGARIYYGIGIVNGAWIHVSKGDGTA